MKGILIWKRVIVVATALLIIAVVPLLASKGEKDVTPVKQPMLIARAYFITLEKRLEIFVTNSSTDQFRLRSFSFVFGESLNRFEGTVSVAGGGAIIVPPGETFRLVTTLDTEIPDRAAIFDLEISGRSQLRDEIELTFTRVGQSLGGDDDE